MAKTKIQSKPAAWRPRKGQWFQAIVKRLNRPHVCGPFKCLGTAYQGQLIEGINGDGVFFDIKLSQFRLCLLDEDSPT